MQSRLGVNENQPELEERHDFFVSGLGQIETIDAARECEHAENVAQLEVERTALDNFLLCQFWHLHTCNRSGLL